MRKNSVSSSFFKYKEVFTHSVLDSRRVECAKGHVLGERCISLLHVSNLMCWQNARINKTKTFLLLSKSCADYYVVDYLITQR